MTWAAFVASAFMAVSFAILAVTSGGVVPFVISACGWSASSVIWLLMALEGR